MTTPHVAQLRSQGIPLGRRRVMGRAVRLLVMRLLLALLATDPSVSLAPRDGLSGRALEQSSSAKLRHQQRCNFVPMFVLRSRSPSSLHVRGRQRSARPLHMILGMDRKQQKKQDPGTGQYPSSSGRPRCLDAACDEEELLPTSETDATKVNEGSATPKNPLANGVVVGSVAALAATPAAEVRTLVLDLCECKWTHALLFPPSLPPFLPSSLHREF